MSPDLNWDVVIVGAGPAGIGIGAALADAGITHFTLLERHEVGASLRRWTHETRFITPSFTANAFGLVDLNAVTADTSPAFSLMREHPSGAGYADYLERVVENRALPIQTGVDVHHITPLADDVGFRITTATGDLTTRYLIWAAGEFQYPRLTAFPGAALCQPTSRLAGYASLTGDDFVVIGGYESGMDAAIALTRRGKRVRVVDPYAPWDSDDPDPSQSLSPYTLERVDDALESGLLELLADEVACVEMSAGQYCVGTATGERLLTSVPPLLAIGFHGSLRLIESHFAWHERGYTLLTPDDESTRRQGLFVVGPNVRHGNVIFCFIYKFRQRFGVVARTIAQRMGLDTTDFEATYRANGFLLDDLTCCDMECAC